LDVSPAALALKSKGSNSGPLPIEVEGRFAYTLAGSSQEEMFDDRRYEAIGDYCTALGGNLGRGSQDTRATGTQAVGERKSLKSYLTDEIKD
jgi:hypothetical protein